MEELLIEDVGPDRLDEVTTLLEPWVRHRNAQQRLSGITILRTALLAYYHNMQLGYQVFHFNIYFGLFMFRSDLPC